MNQDNDRDLEDYLKGDSELSRLYHQDDDLMPPASLDRSIVAAAKAAVGAKQRRGGWLARLFDGDWLTPVSSFAMITLMAIAIYMLIVPDSTGPLAPDSAAKKAPPVESVTSEAPQQAMPVKDSAPVAGETESTHKTLTHVTHRTPESWLQHIDKLYRNNETGLATAEFRKFRTAYPAYPVQQVLGRKRALELEPGKKTGQIKAKEPRK